MLLHAANVILVWLVGRRLALPGAWLAAAVFAVHPVHVESVAWVTERKNVLSGGLYLAAFLAYLRAADGARAAYGLALGLFVGALLAKTVACTLPVVLLLVLWWKHGRVDVAPLLPFFALGSRKLLRRINTKRPSVDHFAHSTPSAPATSAGITPTASRSVRINESFEGPPICARA